MSTFKPKKSRGEALISQIAPVISDMPDAGARRHKNKLQEDGYRTVQINFLASVEFALLVNEIAQKGNISRRQVFARALAAQGHPVPEADLNPPTARRNW